MKDKNFPNRLADQYFIEYYY